MKRSAHAKAVFDDSWITVDTTSLHQHQLLHYLCYMSHSESEKFKLLVTRKTNQRRPMAKLVD